MKRLLSLDWIRGIAIIGVILFHGLIWGIYGGIGNAKIILGDDGIMKLAPVIILGTWGGFFALISAASNTYVLYHKLNKGEKSLKHLLSGTVTNSLLIFLAHFVMTAIFLHFTDYYGQTYQSLFVGFLESGTFVFNPTIMLYADTLILISLSGIIVSLTLAFLWKEGHSNSKKNVKILVILGLVILYVLNPLLHNLLDPIFNSAVENQDYGTWIALSCIVGSRFSIFPYAGYVMFGIIFGIYLAEGVSLPKMKKLGYGGGLFFLIMGILILAIPLAFGKEMDLTAILSAPVLGPELYSINLGLQFMSLTLIIRIFEYRTTAERVAAAKKSVFVRRFGIVGLTVYIFEAIGQVFLSKIYSIINPEYYLNTPMILSYFVVSLLMWVGILKLWEKGNYKYSFEWIIVWTLAKTRGLTSNRLDIRENLYNPIKKEVENQEASPIVE